MVTASNCQLLPPEPEFAQLMLIELIGSVMPTLLVMSQVTILLFVLKLPTVKLEVVQLYTVAVSAAGRRVTEVLPMLAAEVLCTRVEEPVPDGWA